MDYWQTLWALTVVTRRNKFMSLNQAVYPHANTMWAFLLSLLLFVKSFSYLTMLKFILMYLIKNEVLSSLMLFEWKSWRTEEICIRVQAWVVRSFFLFFSLMKIGSSIYFFPTTGSELNKMVSGHNQARLFSMQIFLHSAKNVF